MIHNILWRRLHVSTAVKMSRPEEMVRRHHKWKGENGGEKGTQGKGQGTGDRARGGLCPWKWVSLLTCFCFSPLWLISDPQAWNDLKPNPPFPLHASFNCFLHFLWLFPLVTEEFLSHTWHSEKYTKREKSTSQNGDCLAIVAFSFAGTVKMNKQKLYLNWRWEGL